MDEKQVGLEKFYQDFPKLSEFIKSKVDKELSVSSYYCNSHKRNYYLILNNNPIGHLEVFLEEGKITSKKALIDLKELNASSYNNFITLEYDCLKSERLDKYNEIPFD